MPKRKRLKLTAPQRRLLKAFKDTGAKMTTVKVKGPLLSPGVRKFLRDLDRFEKQSRKHGKSILVK